MLPVVFIVAIIRCCFAKISISSPYVLLPHRTFSRVPINYTINIQGSTYECFEWDFLKPGVVNYQFDDVKCKKSVLIIPTSSNNLRESTTLRVRHSKSDHFELLQCEVELDIIEKLQIITKTRELYAGETPEAVFILGFDSEGNVFSSLSGMQFDWSIISLNNQNPTEILKILNFSETSYEVSKEILYLESNGFHGDTVLIEGLSIGDVLLKVSYTTPQKKVIESTVNLAVRENVFLHPYHDIFVLPNCRIKFRATTYRRGKLIDIDLNQSKSFLKTNSTTSIIHYKNYLYTTIMEEIIQVSLKELFSSIRPFHINVHVVKPTSMKLVSAIWTREVNELFEVSVVFLKEQTEITVYEEVFDVELNFDNHIEIEYRSLNGTYFVLKSISPGIINLNANFHSIKLQMNEKLSISMNVSAVVHIVETFRVKSPIILPLYKRSFNYNSLKLKITGGSGYYSINSASQSIKIDGFKQTFSVSSPNDEALKIVVSDLKLLNRIEMVQILFIIPSKITAQSEDPCYFSTSNSTKPVYFLLKPLCPENFENCQYDYENSIDFKVDIDNETVGIIDSSSTKYDHEKNMQLLFINAREVGSSQINIQLSEYEYIKTSLRICVVQPTQMLFNSSHLAIVDVITNWKFQVFFNDFLSYSSMYDQSTSRLISYVESSEKNNIKHQILCNRSGSMYLEVNFGIFHEGHQILIDNLFINIKCVELNDLLLKSFIYHPQISDIQTPCLQVYKEHASLNEKISITFKLFYKYPSILFEIDNIHELNANLLIEKHLNHPKVVNIHDGYEMNIDSAISFTITHQIIKNSQKLSSQLKIKVLSKLPSIAIYHELLLNEDYLLMEERSYPSLIGIHPSSYIVDIKRRSDKIWLIPKSPGQTNMIIFDKCFQWNSFLIINVTVDIKELLSIDISYYKSHIFIGEKVTASLILKSFNNLSISSRLFKSFTVEFFVISPYSSILIKKLIQPNDSLNYEISGIKIGDSLVNFKINFVSNDKNVFITTKTMFFEVFEPAYFEKPDIYMLPNIFYKINSFSGPKNNFEIDYQLKDSKLCNITSDGIIYASMIGYCDVTLVFITKLAEDSEIIHPLHKELQLISIRIIFEDIIGIRVSSKDVPNVLIINKQILMNYEAITKTSIIPLNGLVINHFSMDFYTNCSNRILSLSSSKDCSLNRLLKRQNCPINPIVILTVNIGYSMISFNLIDVLSKKKFVFNQSITVIEELSCLEFDNNLLLLMQKSNYTIKVQNLKSVKFSILYSSFENLLNLNVETGQLFVNTLKFGYSIIEIFDGYQSINVRVQVVPIAHLILQRSFCHDEVYCALKSIYLGGSLVLKLNALDHLGRLIYGVHLERFHIEYSKNTVQLEFFDNFIRLKSLKPGITSITIKDSLNLAVKTSFNLYVEPVDRFNRNLTIGQIVCPLLDVMTYSNEEFYYENDLSLVRLQSYGRKCLIAANKAKSDLQIKDKFHNDYLKITYLIEEFDSLKINSTFNIISDWIGLKNFMAIHINDDKLANDHHFLVHDVTFDIDSLELKCHLNCSHETIKDYFLVNGHYDGRNIGCQIQFIALSSDRSSDDNLIVQSPIMCTLNGLLLNRYTLEGINVVFWPSIRLISHSKHEDLSTTKTKETYLFEGSTNVIRRHKIVNPCSDDVFYETIAYVDPMNIEKSHITLLKIDISTTNGQGCNIKIIFELINQSFSLNIKANAPSIKGIERIKENSLFSRINFMMNFNEIFDLSTRQIFPIMIVLSTLCLTIILCKTALNFLNNSTENLLVNDKSKQLSKSKYPLDSSMNNSFFSNRQSSHSLFHEKSKIHSSFTTECDSSTLNRGGDVSSSGPVSTAYSPFKSRINSTSSTPTTTSSLNGATSSASELTNTFHLYSKNK